MPCSSTITISESLIVTPVYLRDLDFPNTRGKLEHLVFVHSSCIQITKWDQLLEKNVLCNISIITYGEFIALLKGKADILIGLREARVHQTNADVMWVSAEHGTRLQADEKWVHYVVHRIGSLNREPGIELRQQDLVNMASEYLCRVDGQKVKPRLVTAFLMLF